MSLSKDQFNEWKGLLKNAVLATVEVEVKTYGRDTFINILRFLNGELPKSEKHMMHQGHLAPKMMLQKFMKMNSHNDLTDAPEEVKESLAGTCINLQDAPEEVITDLMTNGKLYHYVADLYVHSFYKLSYELIVGSVENWGEVEAMLESFTNSAEVEEVQI